MVYEVKVRTIKTHKSTNSLIIQFWSWFNTPLKKINSTLVSYVNNNETKLEFVTYYPLHADSPWTGFRNLTRKCYHLSRLPLKSLSYISYLLRDQLTYSNSKEHMSDFTKGITVTTNFMITCPLDHPRRHTVSIPWDIMISLLRILVITNLHQ